MRGLQEATRHLSKTCCRRDLGRVGKGREGGKIDLSSLAGPGKRLWGRLGVWALWNRVGRVSWNGRRQAVVGARSVGPGRGCSCVATCRGDP